MSSFFEALCLADMEKMHSAMIAWMLSDSCTVFSKADRSKMLCSLFGEEPRVFEEIDTYTEWKSIDVIVFTKDVRNIWECWLLENKVKTSQHSDQLKKYESYSIKYFDRKGNPHIFELKNELSPMHFCLLSLIPEIPLGNAPWQNNLYSSLNEILNVIPVQANADKNEKVFVESYKKCINDLCDHLDRFKTSVINGQGLDYEFVFKNGGKKKDEKLPELRHMKNQGFNKNKPDNKTYITENSLETIFQKSYLTYLGQELQKKKTDISFYVTESHGNAQLCIRSENWKMDRERIDEHYKKYNKNSNAKKDPMPLEFSLSFQNGTLGIVFTGDYDNRGGYSAADIELIYGEGETPFSAEVLKQKLEGYEGAVSESHDDKKSGGKKKPRWAKNAEVAEVKEWYTMAPGEIIERFLEACEKVNVLVDNNYNTFKKKCERTFEITTTKDRT